MRSRVIAGIVAIWTAFGGAAWAEGPVVVELFTSQGCSSCPPADKILGELAQRDDVVALALHVDYWDYIGWKDSFANPAFTKRQRAYAHAAGGRTIYTPQMIVGGEDHVIGTKPMELADRINEHREAPNPVDVSIDRNGDVVSITARSQRRVPSDLIVQLVTYSPKETVQVRRGENAGRTLNYHNVVRDWTRVGAWNGEGEYRAKVRVPGGLSVAVLVQRANAGPIVGAAKAR